jgi:hypothetical protein
MWTFTLDQDMYLTINFKGKEVWSGSYEAFVADGDIIPPMDLANKIHAMAERLSNAE